MYIIVLLFLQSCLARTSLPPLSHQDGVTIGLEVLLPKEAKLPSEGNPPLQYDVFLYKVANNGDSVQTDACAATHPNSKSPQTPQTPKSPKSPKSSKRTSDKSPCSPEFLSGRHSSPGRQHSPTQHPSPSRHSAPGCYFSPSCHPQSHHSPSRYKCMASSSSTTPPQLRRPRGRSQAHGSPRSGQFQGGHIHPSPSSPHLTQPPPSPTRVKYSPVSTRSLPPLS